MAAHRTAVLPGPTSPRVDSAPLCASFILSSQHGVGAVDCHAGDVKRVAGRRGSPGPRLYPRDQARKCPLETFCPVGHMASATATGLGRGARAARANVEARAAALLCVRQKSSIETKKHPVGPQARGPGRRRKRPGVTVPRARAEPRWTGNQSSQATCVPRVTATCRLLSRPHRLSRAQTAPVPRPTRRDPPRRGPDAHTLGHTAARLARSPQTSRRRPEGQWHVALP